MPQNVVGSCLCGTVKFQISGTFESFFLCHCKRCRKDSGSAHAANLFSTGATLSWLSGQGSVQTYRLSQTRHEKSFCTTCGSAVPTVGSDGTLAAVPAGSLDSAIDIRPTAHICIASRADWDDGLEDLPMLEDLPG